jgi:murein DD-endopeptidase MepM/ murein hydrolase activator NlpD
MPKQGPERPFYQIPSPKMDPSSNVPIPDEMVLGWIREALSPSEFEEFTSLPQKTAESYINTVKNAWFGATAKVSSSTLNYGSEEFADLAGVQVGISLNPQDWKNPVKYLSETTTKWLKGVVQTSDIERELEKELVGKAMRGERIKGGAYIPGIMKAGAPHVLGDAKILEAKSFSSQAKDIEGGKGVDDNEAYKDYAAAVMGFINDSQSISSRQRALDGARAAHYGLLERELFYGKSGGWVKGNFSVKRKLAEENRIAQSFEQFVNANNINVNTPEGRKIKELFFDVTQKQNFRSVFESDITKLKGAGGLSLASMSVEALGGSKGSSLNNTFALRTFLNRIEFKDPNALKDLKKHLRDNYKDIGFSSPEAVDHLIANLGSINLSGSVSTVLEPAFFRPRAAGTSGVIGTHNGVTITRQDAALMRTVVNDLSVQAGKAVAALTEAQEAIAKYDPEGYIQSIANQLPEDMRSSFIKRARNEYKWKHYMEVRHIQLSTQDFFQAVEKGNFFNAYIYLGKYSEHFKWAQELKNRIDSLPMGGGKTVGDIAKAGAEIKNWVSYDVLGLTQADKVNNTYAIGAPLSNSVEGKVRKRIPLLAKLAKNETTLYLSDFYENDAFEYSFYSYLSGKNEKREITVFTGKTADNYNQISQDFNSKLKSLKPARLRIIASELEGLTTAYEGIFRMSDYVDSTGMDVGTMSKFFADLYDQWLDGGRSMDFLDDGYAITFFQKGLTPATATEMAGYRDSFNKLFLRLEHYHRHDNVDPKDFFAMLSKLQQEKYLMAGGRLGKNGVVEFFMNTHMPLLNKIADRLSSVQTYIFKGVENKLLANTVFKIPGVGGAAEGWWNVYKPGMGSYESAMGMYESRIKGKFIGNMLSKLSKTRFAAQAAKFLPYWMTASTVLTVGIAYLAYAIQRIAARSFQALRQFLQTRDFKVIWFAFKGFLDDLFVAPFKVGLRLVRFLVMGCFWLIAITGFIIMMFFGGGVWNNSEREITTDIAYSDLGTPIDVVCQGGQCCLDGSFGASAGSLASALDHAVSTPVTICPGFSNEYFAGKFHFGLDYFIPMGSTIKSGFKGSTCGKVTLAVDIYAPTEDCGQPGKLCSFGNTVFVEINSGGVDYVVRYAHLTSPSVKVGDTVCAGDTIGLSGDSGLSTTPHLHYEVKQKNGGKVNPCEFLSCPAKCYTGNFDEACADKTN